MRALTPQQKQTLETIVAYNTGRGNRGFRVESGNAAFRRCARTLIRRGLVAVRDTFVGRALNPTDFYVPTAAGRKLAA